MSGIEFGSRPDIGARRGDSIAVAATIVLAAVGVATAQTHVTEGVAGLADLGVEIGDIDGDGRLDVVSLRAANGVANFVTYRGEGFAFSKSGSLSAIGAVSASGLAIGDVDGDGRPDVVTSTFDPVTTATRIYLGLGTPNGTFAVSSPSSASLWKEGELVDLDLDGDLDLVAIDHGKILSLENGGSGSFVFGTSSPEPLLGGTATPLRLAVADFDDDGDPDAAASKPFGAIVLFKTTLTAGDASLALWQSLTAGTSLLDFTAVDLHGDGDLDFAAVGTNPGNELRILESFGSGVFGSQKFLSGGTFSSFVTGGDFDLDGRGDLLTERTVHRSLDSGLPVLDSQHVLPEAHFTRVADFNGDGRSDLLSIGSTFNTDSVELGALILNDGEGRFPAQTGSNSADIRGGFVLAEFTGDAHLDLLTLVQPFASANFHARIEAGDGAGKFTQGFGIPVGAVNVAGASVPPVVAADMNHDGVRDLVVADGSAAVANPQLYVAMANGSGGFLGVTTSALTDSATILHVGRMNADLFLDVILERVLVGTCEYRVAFNDGQGNFTQSSAVTTSPGPPFFQTAEPVAVADVTLDGLEDLIVRTSALGALRVLRSVGDGSFLPSGTIAWSNDGVFTVAELTGDSIPDLALLELVDSSFRLVIRQGFGGAVFAPASPQHVTAGFTSISSLHASDFDGDGIRDLLGVSSNIGGVLIYRGLGGGNFASPVVQRFGVVSLGYPAHIAPLIGDVDGDFRPDLVGVAQSPTNLDEIVVIHGDCGGRTVGYGHGCPGSGGATPQIAILGKPCPGNTVTFEIRNGLGGSLALVFFGGGEGSTPIAGGCELLLSPLLPFSFALPLAGVGPGQGSIAVTTVLPASISGLTFTMQGFVVDPGVSGGASGTPGLAASFAD